MDGRVYVNGRVGEGMDRQSVVAAFDAKTGEPIWERRFNLYLTTVPFNRVGWAAPTGDPETGYIYDQVVSGAAGVPRSRRQDGVVALAQGGVRARRGLRRAHAHRR